MRCNLPSTPAFASVCLIAALSVAPHLSRAQSGNQTGNQNTSLPQVHAITGLPLPPDEAAATPAAASPAAPAPAPAQPTKASRKTAAKASKTLSIAPPTPEPHAPTPTEPEPLPAPVATPAPTPLTQPLAPVADAPPAKIRSRTASPAKSPARTATAAAASAPKVHAILLPPPPEEEPPAAPVPAAPPLPVAQPTPAAVAAPVPAPAPAPVPAPAVIPTPTRKPLKLAPLPPKPQPAAEMPTPVAAPTPPTAPVAPTTSRVAPAPAPARVVAPAKPAPTLKSRSAKAPVNVDIPSATVVSPASTALVVRPAIVSATPTLTPTGKLAPKPAGAPAPAAPAPPPPPPGTLGSILFQGAEPYTQAELAPITGLALGTKPGQDALQLATNRLIDTGLFATVNAAYDTPNDVGTATFALTPMPPNQLAKPSFANLVWLTPAELAATLKTVPLYHDGIPINGKLDLAAQVQAALERELAARHVDATLVHETVAPTQAHPYVAVEFRATAPRVVLASAQVFDVPPALVNKTLAAQAAAVKIPYNEGDAGTTLSDLLLAPARDAGYIGARLWHIERKRRGVNGTVYVDYSARLEAGPIYSVRSVDWVPTPVLSGADFSKLSALHVGQVPTAAAQQQTEQAVLNAYYTKGYLEAAVSSSRTLDSKTGAASYAFTVAAGPQYTVRNIDIEGLDPAARKDFDAAWTMKPGDAYDEPYLLNFLANHPNIESLKGYTFGYNRAASTDTHQVDLTLTFKHN